MPDEHYHFLPQHQLMQASEIESIASEFVKLGVNKIRLTGGEPLVRKDFADILHRLSKLKVQLMITTNGLLIDRYINDLKSAPIHSVNVSLDTLRPEIFFQLTKRDKFQQVWNHIQLLLENNIRVKLNVVALHGIVEDELLPMIALTKDLPLHVRFIEFMPFTGNHWENGKVVTANQMLQVVEQTYDIIKLTDAPNDTAKKYQVIGHQGTFAFITTMSHQFCGDCNRLRLTAEGKIKNCLFGKDELDLLGALRNGQSIIPIIEQSVKKKHQALGGQMGNDFKKIIAEQIDNRSMISIGG